MAEGSAVLFNLLNGVNFYEEMRRYSCSLTLGIAFGKRAPTFHGIDSAGFSVKEFYRLEHAFNFFLEVGAAPPIDLLPALKYLPGPLAPWKARARALREEMRHYYQDILFGELKRRLKKGQCTDAWLAKLVQHNPDNLSDECLAWNGGVMLEGGSDTTSGALLTFVLAACCFPDKARKAQEEIDRVVGWDRSPVLDDIGSLPYCDAFVKEV
jgi:cytochrome P450